MARLFQRSAACVTVSAVGPNAQHFLHATNFGSMSLLIQTSEPPQKGQGCSGCTETGNPRSGSMAAWSLGFPGMLTRSSELDHFEVRQRAGVRDIQARSAQRESRLMRVQLILGRLRSYSNGMRKKPGWALSGNIRVSVLNSGALGFQFIQRIDSR